MQTNSLKDAISAVFSKFLSHTEAPPPPPLLWFNLLLLDPGLLFIYPRRRTPASPAACLCLHWGHGIIQGSVSVYACAYEEGGSSRAGVQWPGGNKGRGPTIVGESRQRKCKSGLNLWSNLRNCLNIPRCGQIRVHIHAHTTAVTTLHCLPAWSRGSIVWEKLRNFNFP